MDLIKTTPDEHDTPPVPAEYFSRSYINVSAGEIDSWLVGAMEECLNPGISWMEMARIGKELAFNWNPRWGRISRGKLYVEIETEALRYFTKQETAKILRNPDDNAEFEPHDIEEKYARPYWDR